jgi:prepilin-type N-terminal cleavage/methylation domain-containing protein
MHAGRRCELGYTLIEIMIVVGIAAIIMGTALPAFTRSARREKLNQAVSDVLEACGTARARAILQGEPMELVFRARDGHIAVRPAKVDKPDATAGGAPDIVAPDEAAAGEVQGFKFDDEIMILMLDVNMVDHMQFPTARVRFYPNGTSDELTLILQSPKGGVKKISLEVVTALADVEDVR